MSLIHSNSLVSDQFLASYLKDLIENEWIQVVIKANGEFPQIKGRAVFSETEFIKSNWLGDLEKQE